MLRTHWWGLELRTEVLWMVPAATLLFAYLLGSIPFGLILTRISGAGDLRQIGSGNIGATNVLRTGRKGLAAATLLLDAGKGALAVLLAVWLTHGEAGLGPLAAMGAFLGHCFPVWLRFNGGKGVATLLGVLLALHWPAGLIYAAVWIGLLLLLRISSVAGMCAAVSAPVSTAFFGRFDLVLLLLLALALILVWKHRGNIDRLLAGTEPRVGDKRNAASGEGTSGASD